MSDRVLLVDDEPNVIQAIRRGLHGKHKVFGAEGGAAGIEMLRTQGPFAVIVSDMQMPDVDGLAVLAEARRIAPDTVRIMLTGNADQQTATNAVNTGAIFRFVNKPCPAEQLGEVLNEAIRQYQLVTAEKQLLSRTLTGSIALVSEVLSIASPTAYGRGSRLRRLAREISKTLQLEDAWQYEIAAMLSYFGCIGVSQNVLEKVANGGILTGDERQALESQAETGSRLVRKIPRLESVADMIALQHCEELDEDLAETVVKGAKLLRLLVDFDSLSQRKSMTDAVTQMDDSGSYDKEMLAALTHLVVGDLVLREVRVSELRESMILDEDVVSGHGEVLIKKGHELTEALIHRLKMFERNAAGVREPFRVQCRGAAPIEEFEAVG